MGSGRDDLSSRCHQRMGEMTTNKRELLDRISVQRNVCIAYGSEMTRERYVEIRRREQLTIDSLPLSGLSMTNAG